MGAPENAWQVGRVRAIREKLCFLLYFHTLVSILLDPKGVGFPAPPPPPPRQAILRRQLDVLQFNSILTLPAWLSFRSQRLRAQSHKTGLLPTDCACNAD